MTMVPEYFFTVVYLWGWLTGLLMVALGLTIAAVVAWQTSIEDEPEIDFLQETVHE